MIVRREFTMSRMHRAAVGLLAIAAACAPITDARRAPLEQPASPDNVPAPVIAPAPITAPAPVTAHAPAVTTTARVKSTPPAKTVRPAVKPEPPLDIAALSARLRSTSAIGIFTKLALKNQMDDLLQQVRGVHQSGRTGGVGALRQPYDMLVLKVLAVLQDGDPPLARTISDSREAIWNILADPEKFNAIA
jgi:hypothetical protein